MTQFLPPNLLALFAARDPIPYLPPVAKLSHEKRRSGFTGIGQYLAEFEDPKDTPPKGKVETRDERRERRQREKAEQMAYKLEQQIAVWSPQDGPASSMDAFKTLFVGRVNYDTSESKLKREFESYGPVKKIVMVFNQKTGKPRGYAFVEYEHERDMQAAYKNADGKKIDGRRVVVDIERGRTVKGWLPRRLGGGLGGTRRGGPEVNVKISGRDHEIDRRGGGDSDRGGRRGRSNDRSRSRHRSRSRDRDRRDRSARGDRDRGDRDKDRDVRDRGDRGDRVERVDRDRRRSRDRRDKDKDKDKDKVKEPKKRKRSRSKSRDKREHRGDGSAEEGEIKAGKKKRGHEKEKKRHRSKSRDRDKDKKKDRKDRDRSKNRNKEIRVKDEPDEFEVRIKDEPVDDYPDYDGYDGYEGNGGYMKPEPGVDRDGNNQPDEYDDGYAQY